MLNTAPKIFISHAWEDKRLVRRVEEYLRAAAVEVWVDHSGVRGGDNLPKRINDALEWCDILLLIWSQASSKSHWVELEWTNVISLKKEIIPCVLDKTKLPAILANKLFIDFSNINQAAVQLLHALKLDKQLVLPSITNSNEELPLISHSRFIDSKSFPNSTQALLPSPDEQREREVRKAFWVKINRSQILKLSFSILLLSLLIIGIYSFQDHGTDGIKTEFQNLPNNDSLNVSESTRTSSVPLDSTKLVPPKESQSTSLIIPDNKTGTKVVQRSPTTTTNRIVVPSMVGDSYDKAIKRLRKAGLVLGNISEVEIDELLPETVIEQSIRGGTKVKKGTAIDLKLSTLPRNPNDY